MIGEGVRVGALAVELLFGQFASGGGRGGERGAVGVTLEFLAHAAAAGPGLRGGRGAFMRAPGRGRRGVSHGWTGSIE